MRKLPLNESSFFEIRTNDMIYVDKTQHILNILNTSKFTFLSRPRRFGKSLTVSTLAALFQGQKELFKHLYIYDKWNFKKYPVLLFDFTEIDSQSAQNLQKSLKELLELYADQYNITLKSSSLSENLKQLILFISQRTNTPVVILVDEYDKPILDHLGQGENRFKLALENREVLRNFFGILKGGTLQTAIKFVFITGISTFSKVSIFSEWNQLTDISRYAVFSSLVGYTHEELLTYFQKHIQKFAEYKKTTPNKILNLLKQWYNDYRFSLDSEIKVYNPISILSALQQHSIQNYWFTTGTPSYLINLLKERTDIILELDNLEVTPEFISIYDLETLPLETIFYQSGYLTIKAVKDEPVNEIILGYPNREVYLSFTRVILSVLYQTKNTGITEAKYLVKSLIKNNFDQSKIHINNILALIPNRLWKKIKNNEKNEDKIITEERFYQTIIYLSLYASGYMAEVEVINIGGFADLVLKYKEKVFIFEIKIKGSAKTVLKQIKQKGYQRKYIKSGKEIYLIGIIMNTQKRKVKEIEIEKIVISSPKTSQDTDIAPK